MIGFCHIGEQDGLPMLPLSQYLKFHPKQGRKRDGAQDKPKDFPLYCELGHQMKLITKPSDLPSAYGGGGAAICNGCRDDINCNYGSFRNCPICHDDYCSRCAELRSDS